MPTTLSSPDAVQTPATSSVDSLPEDRIELGDSRQRLMAHPVYGMIDRPERIRRFMEAHVWAVWDFQSLLTAVQRKLTCVCVPWRPTADAEARRLVNEIVLDEESDLLPDGSSASHFELYLDSMRAAGADTGSIERALESLSAGASLSAALEAAAPPAAARRFVERSFSIIESDAAHRVVAAFTYGREDVIPDMFRQLVVMLAEDEPAVWGRFRFYLERHIEHDDERHGPICRRIVARLCGNDPVKWAEASETARLAIESRIELWDAVAENLSRQA